MCDKILIQRVRRRLATRVREDEMRTESRGIRRRMEITRYARESCAEHPSE